MERVIEEYGQAFLAMIVMMGGFSLAFALIVNKGLLYDTVTAYMGSICG